jgi:hypothetical protein
MTKQTELPSFIARLYIYIYCKDKKFQGIDIWKILHNLSYSHSWTKFSRDNCKRLENQFCIIFHTVILGQNFLETIASV